MEVLNKFFTNEGKSYYLNKSETRSLKVTIDAVYPQLKLLIRITAIDHKRHVEFSKETWNMIVQKASEIRQAMRSETEESIFTNQELRVFTELMHDQCAVCFIDARGSRVNMMDKTFKKMMSYTYEVASDYQTQIKEVKNVAKNLTLFFNVIFIQLTQCNVDNTEFNEFLIGLQQQIDTLSNLSDSPSFEYYDEMFEDEDYYDKYDNNYCRRCGRSDDW